LAPAVLAALAALGEQGPVASPVTIEVARRTEVMLRGALQAHQTGPDGQSGHGPTSIAAAAVRAACAFLGAVAVEDAYLTLCSAAEHLRR
jgi:hypothetical protein